MTDYSDGQIGRGDLPRSDDYGDVMLMQAGQVQEAATNAYMRQYNFEAAAAADTGTGVGPPDPKGPGGGRPAVYTPMKPGDKDWLAIKNDLSWLIDVFDQLSRIPGPEKSEQLAASVSAVVGTDSLVDPGGKDAEIPIGDKGFDATGGLLGDRAMDGRDNIAGAVEDWQGSAAYSFKNNFLKDLPSTIRNQTALGTVLRDTAVANAGLMLAARKDSQELARKAKEVLDAYDPADTGQSDGVTTGFAVVAALTTIAAGVAAIALPAAPAAAGALTVLAGIGSAGALADEKKEPIGLGADTVEGILDKIFDAYLKIINGIRDAEDILINKVILPNAGVTHDHTDMFVPSRPDIAGASPERIRKDFRPPEV